jgi:hypothetical protein
LAIFGDANSIDLENPARHLSDANSGTYRKDAVNLYRMNLEHPTLANKRKNWTALHIEGSGNSKLMAAASGHQSVDFDKLGDNFVRKILGIRSDHVLARNPIFLIRTARENVRGSQCPNEIFRQFKETLNTV